MRLRAHHIISLDYSILLCPISEGSARLSIKDLLALKKKKNRMLQFCSDLGSLRRKVSLCVFNILSKARIYTVRCKRLKNMYNFEKQFWYLEEIH